MKTIFAAAAVLSVAAAVPALSDFGKARASYRTSSYLAESCGPSPGGHDTALAEAEPNGPSPG